MPPSRDPTSPRAILRALPRAVDDLPIWAQLNITWKCNLDCAYCTEYDNGKGHVPKDEVIRRIDKCKDLGVRHTDLIGGEPMLHPDVIELMRTVVDRGMTTGMTTNGFLLNEDRMSELIDAGMGRIQISVDAVHPTREAPKSLKTLRKKIEMVARRSAAAGVWFYVNTVICDQTLDDVEEVARTCFDLGVGIQFSVVHARGRLVRRPNDARFLEKVRWLRDRKLEGAPVHTPYFLIHYYEESLQGRPLDWTCQAGNKTFYVSPEGHFHFCYHVPPQGELHDVTRAQMAGNRGKKGCEERCGVDCVLHTSLPFSKLGTVVRIEARDRIRAAALRLGVLPPLSPGPVSGTRTPD
jgi:MoaA/NifB/PqqE/SkfB family radical SAM enzyme